MQQGMLFHYLSNSSDTSYCEQLSFGIDGEIDFNSIQGAFDYLLNKYDAFRTVVMYKGLDRPIQIILKERKEKISYIDLQHMDEEKKRLYVRDFEKQDVEKGFDLEKDVLLRISIIKLGSKRYNIVWTYHHIVLDGWCSNTVMDDFFTAYYKLKNNQTLTDTNSISISGYIDWLEKKDKEAAYTYWGEYLSDYQSSSLLPLINKKDTSTPSRGEEFYYTFSHDLTSRLTNMAQKSNLTLNSVFQTIWGILLQKLNFSNDVVFGKVTSGRSPEIKDVDKMVGLFVNTVPIRVVAQGTDTFFTIVNRTHQYNSEVEQHSYISLAELQSKVYESKQLFDHIVSFQNVGDSHDNSWESKDLGFSINSVKAYEKTNYDLSLTVKPGDELNIKFSFNPLCYTKDTISRIARYLENIAVQVVENPNLCISEIQVLSEDELEMIQQFFLKNKELFYSTILAAFEDRVTRFATHPAIVLSNNSVTYDQLNRRANRLAYRLKTEGIGKEDVVGILSGPHLDMIVGILAVLKAGAAYLPIDPNYPVERINFMLVDSRASVLLIHPACQ
ncbi:condensation domain-containing protein, partial [Peribacillus simplex]|uniref:condensation domain-containing protein n=1 Tax=Peribacillus simplex TaxID=1478 RepID=UPI003D29C26E